MASVSWYDTIRVWQVSDGRLLYTLEKQDSEINSFGFSPDGKMLAAELEDGTTRLWNVADGELMYILEGHTNRAWDFAFSPDGRRLATSSDNGTIRLWAVVG